MKQLGQSQKEAQLWMCLMRKGMSDAVKINIMKEPAMEDLWLKEAGCGQTGD